MECPHCKKYIASNKNRCNYCGNKIPKKFLRKLGDFLFQEKIDEKKFIEAVTTGNYPAVKSEKEIELYIKHKVKNEEISIIVCEALGRAGTDGFFEV